MSYGGATSYTTSWGDEGGSIMEIIVCQLDQEMKTEDLKYFYILSFLCWGCSNIMKYRTLYSNLVKFMYVEP